MTRAWSHPFARPMGLALLLSLTAGGCSREEGSEAEGPAARPEQAAAPAPMDSTMPGMAHGMAPGMAHGPEGAAQGAAPTSAAAGMDHPQMGSPHAQGGAAGAAPGHAIPSTTGTAGMDHARMRRAAAPSGMEGMDHGRMAGGAPPSPGAAAAGAPAHAQHDRAPEAQVSRGQERTTPPAEHALAHGKADSPLSGADTEGLLRLVRALVEDPVVQGTIRADPALREAWDDPAVRALILAPR